MLVKICGITRLEEAAALNELRPDFAGFIVDYPQSRRYIEDSQLHLLASALDPAIRKVGVFTQPDIQRMKELVDKGWIDIVQLHQPERPDLMEELHQAGIPVIQVYERPDAPMLQQAARSQAEWILLDSGKGSGRRLETSLLEGMERPCLLAGGLDEHLEDLPACVVGVDVSTGVETNGRKDPQKIAALLRRARSHQP